MPTYTYRCKNCGHEFDHRQRMSDAPLKKCPDCGGPLRRVVGSVGVVFKGSGFYVTDNKRASSGKNRTRSSETSSDTADKPDSSDSKSTESKPEKKSTEKAADKS